MEYVWDSKKFLVYPPKYKVEKEFIYNDAHGNNLDALIIANCTLSNTLKDLWKRCKAILSFTCTIYNIFL